MKKLIFLITIVFVSAAAFSQYNSAYTFINGLNNSFSTDQNGFQNEASQLVYGNDNSTGIEQIGHFNDHDVDYCPTCVEVQPYYHSDWMQFVYGHSNNLWIGVYGSYNHTAQYVVGHFNKAAIDIYGNGNHAAQEQSGNANEAEIDIYGGAYGHPNYAMTQQVGNGNLATITQGSSSNFVYGNCAGIGEYGNNNSISIAQMSNFNCAQAIVHGNGNGGYINQ